MIYRKLSVFTMLILCAMQASAMKRSGDELAKSDLSKRQHVGKNICLYTAAVKHHSSAEFKEGLHCGNPNQKHHDRPIAFHMLNEMDKLRFHNIESAAVMHQWPAQQQLKDKIAENDNKIEELHECLKLTISHKSFNPHSVDRDGTPLLDYLIERNFEPIYYQSTQELLASKDEMPLMNALLQVGAPVNKLNAFGYAPLHLIAMGSRREEDPLELDFFSYENSLKIVEALVKYGADVNGVTTEGKTPLHFAASDVTTSLLLCSFGAFLDVKDQSNESPIDLSGNPRARDILTHSSTWIDKVRNNISATVFCQSKSENFLHNLHASKIGQQPFNREKNPYPYTNAVLKTVKDAGISVESIMKEMGYRLAGNESSTDEESGSDEWNDQELI